MPEPGTDIRMGIGFQNSISGLTKKSILTSLLHTVKDLYFSCILMAIMGCKNFAAFKFGIFSLHGKVPSDFSHVN